MKTSAKLTLTTFIKFAKTTANGFSMGSISISEKIDNSEKRKFLNIKAISYNTDLTQFEGNPVTLIGFLEANHYNGETTVQFKVTGFKDLIEGKYENSVSIKGIHSVKLNQFNFYNGFYLLKDKNNNSAYLNFSGKRKDVDLFTSKESEVKGFLTINEYNNNKNIKVIITEVDGLSLKKEEGISYSEDDEIPFSGNQEDEDIPFSENQEDEEIPF